MTIVVADFLPAQRTLSWSYRLGLLLRSVWRVFVTHSLAQRMCVVNDMHVVDAVAVWPEAEYVNAGELDRSSVAQRPVVVEVGRNAHHLIRRLHGREQVDQRDDTLT